MVVRKPGKRGATKAVAFVRDTTKRATPEPKVLRIIGQESVRNGASTLTSRQIEKVIKTSRSQKAKA